MTKYSRRRGERSLILMEMSSSEKAFGTKNSRCPRATSVADR